MATRYVGPGGNDGNSGLTWALRKLTLNGVEDTPVVANDVVYIGPGVYRERLIVDVSGGAGTEIIYIGDVSGEHTDGVGGLVRVTGSDNDQTAVRTQCINISDKDYRIFRGMCFDLVSNFLIISTNGSTDITIEDCFFQCTVDRMISVDGTSTDWTIRRCILHSGGHGVPAIMFSNGVTVSNTGHLIENCLLLDTGVGIRFTRIGGAVIRNCAFIAQKNIGIHINQALAVGQTLDVENCYIVSQNAAMQATVLGEIIEDYNSFFANTTDRTNVAVGGNSLTYPPLFLPPLLHSGAGQISGFKFPWWFGELSEWSQIRAITGSNEPTEELRGIARPVTASKNSWGPCQFFDMERETGTVRTGSSSIVLHDAGRHQIWVPVTATSTTIKIYVYREANYAGNLPQMIIKQPGQADDVTTDVGGAGGWNLLTTTLVPAADPPYVVVELVSRNTAVALAYETFFDDLDVS